LAEVTAYSPVVGGNTVTLPGAVGGVPKFSGFSPALRMTVGDTFVGKARGVLTGVTATTFTNSQAGWAPAALSQAVNPYFVRIRSGAASGTWWLVSTTANTATTVTIVNRGLDPTSVGLAAGDAYEIVPGDTLVSLLGSLATSLGGTSAATADAIRVHDGVNWREYYYNTSVSKWREGASTFDRSNTVIRPDAGVVIIRKSAGDLSMRLFGSVSDTNEAIMVNPAGVTVIGSVFPVARTLGSFAVQNMPGFVMNTGNIAASDKVTFFDGVNWRSFQYNVANSQWREGASTFNRNNLALPFGTPIIIERGTAAAGGPVLLTLQIPYSLL
jgi:hypothetical protein